MSSDAHQNPSLPRTNTSSFSTNPPADELKRTAGYGLVIGISITAMIGTGIFFGPSIATSYVGPASILSWAILALITLYVGLCFAELSSMFPDAGGVYEFAKRAYGRFTSFLVGWITWLVNTITAAVIISAAVSMLSTIVPIMSTRPEIGILVAIAIIMLLNFIAFLGIEASTAVMIFFAFIIVGVVVFGLVAGFTQFDPSNFTPFFTASPLFVLVALFFILETFFGWESPTFMGSETKNPQKVIPNSIMITTGLVIVLGLLYAISMTGYLPANVLQTIEVPIIGLTESFFGNTGMVVLIICIVLALIGTAAGAVVSSPRLILALARDRLFIEQLSVVHKKTKTPHKAIVFQTLVSIFVVVATFGNYESILSLLVPLALLMYISVVMAVPICRKKYPDKYRYMKAPKPFVGSIIISLFYVAVIIAWLMYEPNAWLFFKQILTLIAFSLPIFLLLNIYYNPDFITRLMNNLAFLNKLVENITLPREVRQEILSLFGNLKGKKVLEFGSGVGTLTLPLAEIVGVEGHVYTTDLSPNNIQILHKRMSKQGHKHYSAIHDEHLISRVHPDIPFVEMIFSTGNLAYVQNVRRVLTDMKKLLPENGRICFVEYVDYFWGIIPNQPWLDEEQSIQELFRECGFSVRIRKRKGLFWNYLYIYGMKTDRDIPVI